MTNPCIHRLVSRLKNIPELSVKSAIETLPLFHFWFNVGRHNMTNKCLEKVQRRWIKAWGEWAKSETGPAWDAARKYVTPAFLEVAESSRHTGKSILRAICKGVQEQAGNGMWYLPCRTIQDVMKSVGIERTFMTTSRWILDLIEEGFLVKCDYRDPDYPDTQYYMTADAVNRCKQMDRQRLTEGNPTNVPRNRLTTPQRPPDVIPTIPGLAHAGRDEPVVQTFSSDLSTNHVSINQQTAALLN
jgi:hypothetical protein